MQPRKPAKKATRGAKKRRIDPLLLSLNAPLPGSYSLLRKEGPRSAGFVSSRWEIQAAGQGDGSQVYRSAGQYVVNQILCDTFLNLNSVRYYLVCWEGFDLPEWVQQNDVLASIQNQYHVDDIVAYYAYDQLVRYFNRS